MLSLMVKELGKLITIWQSYRQESGDIIHLQCPAVQFCATKYVTAYGSMITINFGRCGYVIYVPIS